MDHGLPTRSTKPEDEAARTANQTIPKWAYLLFILLAGFVTYRIFQHRATEIKAAQPAPRPASVAKVITKDVPLYLDEIGTCAAYETVQVPAQVTGVIIGRHFQDGSDVKKGDLLFTIDPRPFQAVLDQAKAQAALDEVTLKRQEDLRARKVIAQQDYDIAVANAKKSQAATEAAQVNLDYCFIKSPINGRIGLRNVDVGNLVGPSSSTLVTIQGLDPIYTDFTVAENDLPLVRKYLGGPNVKVETSLADGSITPRVGDLYFIDHAVQPGSGTVKARGVTPNPDRALWPSEFVLVRFILDTLKDATLVPSQAVQISQGGPFVFVVKSDNTVELRPVTPGQRQQGDLTVIESGVKPDETVVVTGQLALSPGAKIAPQPVRASNPRAPDRTAAQKAQCRMNDADEHDGEREVKDHDRRRSRSFARTQPDPTAKLVPVKGSGLSGPFIRRPVMTVLLTLSVIVAGLATYGKLAVNDLPAVDYPVIQVSCSYPGADPTTMANNIATPLEKQFLQIPGLDIITSTSTQSNTSAHIAICSEQKHHGRRDRRAGRNPARHRQVANRSAESADIHENKPERPGGLLVRPDVGHADRRRSI